MLFERGAGALRGAGPAVRGFALREWGPLFGRVRAGLAARGWRAVPLTLAAVCLTSLLQWVQNQPWGYAPVQAVGAVRAEEPLWLALVRTPLSLFVPALDLPVWGALAQILVVFGIAEVCLGRRRTLLVAYAATLAGTLYARVGVALGPDGLLGPVGLPASDARVVDTGPSAAVVGLAVYVCWRHRARLTAWLVVAAMVVEVVVKPNLAGKEHLAAIAGVAAAYAVAAWWRRRSAAGAAAGSAASAGAATGPAASAGAGTAAGDGPRVSRESRRSGPGNGG
ncbi:hypothetical protein [Streptomyces sp. CC228A]|uniref:hypothetical protein n=1 Tax=Streptomyces sp. CC228A TaxID=2898186 RepID=UPI001F16EE42|nr:hypothetical protein [Streptomyces sp. CC228A]